MKLHSACDDEKAIWQSFILRSLITHQQERNNSYVSQLQPVGRKSNSFVLPLGWIAQNNKMQNQIHVFLDKEVQDSVFKAWYWKSFCLKSLNSLVVKGCALRGSYILGNVVHDMYDSNTWFSIEHLTKPVITLSFIRAAAQVYVQYMLLCHGHDGCQLQIRFPGLTVESPKVCWWNNLRGGQSGSRRFPVFCIMSVLLTSPSLQIGNDMCEPLFQGTFN